MCYAVVILKTGEYTKADRSGVENTSRETKIIEYKRASEINIKRVYIVKVSSPCMMILENATKTPRYLYSASGARGLHNYSI